MKKVINNIHKNYPKSSNTTWWRLPEEVKDIEDRTTLLEGRDLSDFKNESENKFIGSLDLAELGQQIKFDFKKGSIGEKVSFTKVSGTNTTTNKDIIIPGELEITRGNSGGGIFNIAVETNYNSSNNSPENTFWNTQYVDSTNTSWSSLWDLENRSFTDWRNAIETPSGSIAPPQYVGMPAVMKWDNGGDDPRYWLIMFTHWGVGNNDDYGFAYDRYEILPAVSFKQPSTSNTQTPNEIDIVSEGVHITRRYTGGALYNTVSEPQSNGGVSPVNTKWNSSYTDTRLGYSGFDNLNNLESRVYADFVNSLDYSVGNNIMGEDLIMYDMTTDLYYKVVFDSWASGCNSGPGEPTDWDITNAGSGYPDGGWYNVNPIGGSGGELNIVVMVSGGIINNIQIQGGQNYIIGDVITLNYPGVTNPTVIEITAVCLMGGFEYTRTVIPQSNGIKFADGTVMNTAVTASTSASGTEMTYVQGIVSPEVESDFIKISDTITTAPVDGVVSAWTHLSSSGSWTVGTYTNVYVTGGSGYGATMNIQINSIGSFSTGFTNGGSGYAIGDTVTAVAGGTTFNFEIDNVDTIPAITNSVYKLGGIANFQESGSNLYSYLIGVIQGDSNLKLINDATVISAPVNTFENVSGKFAVNAYVRDNSGNITPLTFASIILDNTIASSNEYFVSIVATATPDWTGTAYIDLEFMSDQTLSYYN